jgi:hypothetical protein
MKGYKVGPRGEPTWPDWRKARVGTRVRLIQTGWTGTVIAVVASKSHGYVRIQWDQSNSAGVVTAPAYDLEVI